MTIDGTAPTVTAAGPSQWSTETNVPFSWSGSDAVGVASYDVELARDGGAFELLLAGTTSTSTSIVGAEGETLTIRVTATDGAGNTSTPSTHTTMIDAIPPQISLSPSFPRRGTAMVQVDLSNIGAPVTATYFFGVGNGTQIPLLGNTVSYTNLSSVPMTATIRVTASDATGRDVSTSSSVKIPSALRSPNLRILSAKSFSRRLLVRGRAVTSAARRVSLLVERVGKVGSRRKLLHVELKRGKFSARIKLSHGRYRVTASVPQSNTFMAQKTTKRIRVK